MTLHPCIIGIDVSKATLDIFEASNAKSTRIDNTDEAIQRLAPVWHEAGALVIFEATGRYAEALRRVLSRCAVPFQRVSPDKARSFARYAGFLAKTDKLDARMLAALGKASDRPADPPFDEAREALMALQRRRDQLVSMRQMERTRAKGVLRPEERAGIERLIAFLSQEVAEFDDLIHRHIDACERLKQAQARLCQVHGIGKVSAAALLAFLPELGQRSGKTIAALVGLAPLNRDSGRHHGQRSIRGGRKSVRDKLFMAAVAASRSHSHFADIYQKLIVAGKPPKVALIALARKILLTANAILRDAADYVPKPASNRT